MDKYYTDAQLAKLLQEMGCNVDFTYKPDKVRRRPRAIESAMQQAFVKWWNACSMSEFGLPDIALMASQAQGARDGQTAARMKREGMRKGQPDLLLARKAGKYGALWIEFKTEDGRVDVAQQRFHSYLSVVGYKVVVVRSVERAIEEINRYLRPHLFNGSVSSSSVSPA